MENGRINSYENETYSGCQMRQTVTMVFDFQGLLLLC